MILNSLKCTSNCDACGLCATLTSHLRRNPQTPPVARWWKPRGPDKRHNLRPCTVGAPCRRAATQVAHCVEKHVWFCVHAAARGGNCIAEIIAAPMAVISRFSHNRCPLKSRIRSKRIAAYRTANSPTSSRSLRSIGKWTKDSYANFF